MRTGFWWGNLKGGEYFEALELDGKIILKLVLK
jgi:hypothetical protein